MCLYNGCAAGYCRNLDVGHTTCDLCTISQCLSCYTSGYIQYVQTCNVGYYVNTTTNLCVKANTAPTLVHYYVKSGAPHMTSGTITTTTAAFTAVNHTGSTPADAFLFIAQALNYVQKL